MITRNRLAESLGTSGDTAGAVAMLEQLVTDRLAILGANHVATLGARTSLAEWHGKAGDPGTAVSMLESVVSDRTKLLGAHHLSTLTTRRALIRWRGECGDEAGAVAALARFWQIWRPRSPENTRKFSGPDTSLPTGELVPGIQLVLRPCSKTS